MPTPASTWTKGLAPGLYSVQLRTDSRMISAPTWKTAIWTGRVLIASSPDTASTTGTAPCSRASPHRRARTRRPRPDRRPAGQPGLAPARPGSRPEAGPRDSVESPSLRPFCAVARDAPAHDGGGCAPGRLPCIRPVSSHRGHRAARRGWLVVAGCRCGVRRRPGRCSATPAPPRLAEARDWPFASRSVTNVHGFPTPTRSRRRH